MQDQATAVVADAGNGGQAGEERPAHPVAVLSAAVLRAGREVLGDSREVFAGRVGVSADLVAGIEDGTRPAWQAPGPQMERVAGALGPAKGEDFWTAAMCDLLLTSVLSGDWLGAGIAATDALGDPGQRDSALLLAWAVHGTDGHGLPLLSAAERDLLRDKAAELAVSGTEDAWVGAHLLTLFPDQFPPMPVRRWHTSG